MAAYIEGKGEDLVLPAGPASSIEEVLNEGER
jgi:hypothetical protein